MAEHVEIWKDCLNDPGYEVSNLGRVRSKDRIVQTSNGQNRFYRGQMLRPGMVKSGHLTVACGKGNSRSVHVLVLEAFVGPAPKGKECLHKNGVPWDNRWDNLRWGTRSQNIRDNAKHGKGNLTTEQADEIRRRFKPRHSVDGGVALAAEFGVPPHVIYGVTNGGFYSG